MLIAVDPGVHKNAYALFRDSLLISIGYDSPDLQPGARVIIENPTLYGGRAARGSGKSILDLSRTVGALQYWTEARGASSELVSPARWKGQVCKPICHSRVWRELGEIERERVAEGIGISTEKIIVKITAACERYARTHRVSGYSWSAHNLLDAIGIGLWALKRTP